MKEKGKEKSKERLTAALLVTALLVLFLISAFALYSMGILTLPAFVTDIINSFKEEEPPANNNLEELIFASPKDQSKYLTMDDIDMKQVLITSTVSKVYLHEFSVTYTYGEKSYTRIYSAIRQGDKYNIKVFEEGALVNTIVCDAKNILITDEVTGEQRTLSASDLSYEEVTNTVSVDDVINIAINFNGTPSESLYGKVFGCEVLFTRLSSANIASIVIQYDETGKTYDLYSLDLKDGEFLMCESYRESQLFMRMTTKSFSSDISQYDLDSLFIITA